MNALLRTVTSVAAAAMAARLLAARYRRFAFRDAVVLIVGGSRGLGLELARGAAARGAKLALVARSGDELEAACEELRAAGAVVRTAVADVRDDAALRAAIDGLALALGPVDVLIYDAGVICVGPVNALALADYEKAIEVNYLGAVRAVEAVRPAMQARRNGRIVTISSIGGKIAVPHLLPYCASKFALAAYSEGLRAELARYDVTVTTVIPGLMRTGSPPHATFAGQTKREYELFALSDALPFTSVSVAQAARQILDGCERGDIETVISWQAKAAVAAYALAPRAVVTALSWLGRILPDAGEHPEHRSGRESETPLTQSPLTASSRRATQTQNEAVDPDKH